MEEVKGLAGRILQGEGVLPGLELPLDELKLLEKVGEWELDF